MPRIIVRRGCTETRNRLKEVFAGDPDVQIIWDRRHGERRRSTRQPAPAGGPQRRQTDRRRPAPDTWTALDFILIKD